MFLIQAKNTIRSYESEIKKWQQYCEQRGFVDCPATSQNLCEFIAHMAMSGAPLTFFLKLSPAITFLHNANRINKPLAINEPFVKLVLDGAKREAAENKPRVKKSSSISQSEMHQLIDKILWRNGVGVLGPDPNLMEWRTVVRLYTYFKCFCRFDCYQQLMTENFSFNEDHVCIEFRRAKNDQFYGASYSLLSALPESPYCPKLIFESYFSVMKFALNSADFLNCRILTTKS